ncbi:MAG: GAF domain-containing sensor histidine kinase [Anaerolineae bacterium]|nr:GAF domain-containing sensor histidine kinase [Anaerolineae bacterium]
MSDSTTLIAAGIAVAYGVLLLSLLTRSRERQGIARRWLMLAVIVAAAGVALWIMPADAQTNPDYEALFVGDLTQPALAIILVNLMLVLFGAHTLRYLGSRFVSLWILLGLVWFAAQAATSFMTDDLTIGQDGWYRDIYDPILWPNILAFGGWLVIGVLLLLAALYAFYRARLPEIANQALFMTLVIPLILVGVAMGASGKDVLAQIGWVVQFAGLGGAVYSVQAYRVLDIRQTFRRTAATSIMTGVTAIVLFIALVVAQDLEKDTTDSLYLILGALAILVAVIYIPLRTIAEAIVMRLFGRSQAGISHLLRQFTEDITGVVDLEPLVETTMRTMRDVLRVRRGGLILVTGETETGLLLEPLPLGMGEIMEKPGQVTPNTPIYNHFVSTRKALLQYDLDYASVFKDTPPADRQFFQQTRMSAYAPVIVQGSLVGILCCGAKISDDPFTDFDLELLMTVANQTGVALRNARLVSDLRRREAEQAALARTISETKEQLERLDSVKTDFITIASHELRTPLAQIRGYTDIMEAMNEQGLLDQDQMSGMTMNLRKAADRLENLIGAMLDTSQLDVNAMDLRFAQTSVEHCMRTAIEPLTESVKQRKLMLSARGLRDLPPIQADMQRLVQAFRNVVLNAIKYTPDGGRIDISGQLQEDTNTLVITIKDSGIGIAKENHELIFEKFFRAHDPSLHSTGATKFMGAGPGLGLTIARGVITAHGGKIWVESPGHDAEAYPGSTFYISLPLIPPEEAKEYTPYESTVSLSTSMVQDELKKSGVEKGDKDKRPTDPKPPKGLRG